MNYLKMSSQNGTTLIELIILMVVLAVGFTGVLTVIMTVTNSKQEPLTKWQAIQTASTVIDVLLSKHFYSANDCVDSNKSEKIYLCEYQGIEKQKLKEVFPEIAAQLGNTIPFDVSVDLKAFNEEKLTRDVLAINVTISNPQMGDIRLSALKAARNQDEKKAKRIHLY
jgi:type II secretory pathway pseudopilin PulG